jgi:hypothetical protein
MKRALLSAVVYAAGITVVWVVLMRIFTPSEVSVGTAIGFFLGIGGCHFWFNPQKR